MIKPPKSWEHKATHFIEALDSNWYKMLAEIQNELCFATYDFYRSKNMKTLFLPVTTNSISSPMGLGSDSLPVEVLLFGQKTYLADSMQFMLEYGCRYFSEGCFYLMPSFRGEKADQRHLCQFYHSEAEIPGSLNDVILFIEEYVRYLCTHLLKNCSSIIADIAGSTEHVTALLNKSLFPRISYDDALKLLATEDGCLLSSEEKSFVVITSKGERTLIHKYGGIVWLTDMDKSIVPFYQACEDGTHAKCADLLFGIGETVGCGERHMTSQQVLDALNEHQVDPISYDWYLKMKERYPLKTSGFGMGTERFMLWLLKQDDIRDFQLLPRFNGDVFIP